MTKRFIVADPKKCSGCGVCELICSGSKDKVFNPRISRIRIVRTRSPDVETAIACRLCENPMCVRCCPRDALSRNEETGVISVSETRCDGCGWCVEVCEFGAAMLHPAKKVAVICDLCGGDPLCVKSCPQKALGLATLDVVSEKTRRSVIEKTFESPKSQAIA